jgi:transposase-like protein
LIKEIGELGYTGTGRKYGVSDNSIRKWKKNFEKEKI